MALNDRLKDNAASGTTVDIKRMTFSIQHTAHDARFAWRERPVWLVLRVIITASDNG
ncbi:putative uncharacterized protein [Pseudomonas sp. StFLB209]|nr:putative uncharacterized protein [Pseudomonas sp. StFLB209]